MRSSTPRRGATCLAVQARHPCRMSWIRPARLGVPRIGPALSAGRWCIGSTLCPCPMPWRAALSRSDRLGFDKGRVRQVEFDHAFCSSECNRLGFDRTRVRQALCLCPIPPRVRQGLKLSPRARHGRRREKHGDFIEASRKAASASVRQPGDLRGALRQASRKPQARRGRGSGRLRLAAGRSAVPGLRGRSAGMARY